MGGPGPRMGEFREERGERMIERMRVVLDLTDAQSEKLDAVLEEHRDQFKDLDRSKMTRKQRLETRKAHRQLLANRVKEVLTDEQKEKFDEWFETLPDPPRRGRRGR
jgi:chromosome segregation ATPase